jgi:hypothetical protein
MKKRVVPLLQHCWSTLALGRYVLAREQNVTFGVNLRAFKFPPFNICPSLAGKTSFASAQPCPYADEMSETWFFSANSCCTMH